MTQANVHPKVLQELMGHKSIKVRMDEYGHLFAGQKEAAVDAFDQFLERSSPDHDPIAAPAQ